jgi:hypothetical protein
MPDAVRNPTAAEAKSLADRIAASSGFQRSPRLRELLQFIVQSSIDHPGCPLTEQQIGIAVFRRPPQYDSSSDTIVRVQVSQLRKRLEHFYLTEGASEPLILEIPRGAYNAAFSVRHVDTEPGEGHSAELKTVSVEPAHTQAGPRNVALPPARGRLVPMLVGALVLLTTLCCVLGYRLWQADKPAVIEPSLRLLWSNLIRPDQKTTVVVADSGFGFLQDALGAPMDLDHYLQHDPQQWVHSFHPDPHVDAILQMLAFRQYTSIADMAVSRRILELNPALHSQVSVVFARNFNARSAESGNVILLGSQRSNPWVNLYLPRLNFLFDYDETQHKAVVRNQHPRPQESGVYRIAGEGHGIKEGYAVVAFLPNSTGTGNVLILAGTDMEATEAVGSVVTKESGLHQFLKAIGANNRMPYVEALFETRRLGGAPQECKLIAFRPINN